ncbi:hypothetical protein Q7P37_006095 [Cladosporium fusiforme]
MLALLNKLFVAFFVAIVAAQIEEPSFNAVEALKNHGIDVSKLPFESVQERSLESSCAVACESLHIIYGNNLIEPESTSYNAFAANFWSSIQGNRKPACVFKAPTKASVSVAVLLSRVTRCRFAARSGGHAAFEDASNIQGGVTISFEKLNDISISSDRSIVTLGPGNDWQRVYSYLAEYDLTAIGGRFGDIGVGGLTTGGGISFWSNLYGWACDNVASYDVVLASGRQVTASPTSHTDLYWALRGGGNNFGLVVSFTLGTVPLPRNEMWTSIRTYDSSSFSSVTRAFHDAIVNSPDDPNAGLWVAWAQLNGTNIAVPTLWHSNASIANGNSSSIVEPFNAIPHIAEDTRTVRLTDFTREMEEGNPFGLREAYFVVTVKADPELANIAQKIFFEELPATAGVKGGFPTMAHQGITSGQMAGMAKRGGNPLGLDDVDRPLFIIQVSAWWELEQDDDTIYAFASKVLRRVKAEAKKRGKASRYLYMNYASKFQDVVASYGEGNKDRLMGIAKEYDPKRVFQELQPGYFKLEGPPVRDERYFSG